MTELTARDIDHQKGSITEKMVRNTLQQAMISAYLEGTLGHDAGLGSDGVHLGEFTAQAIVAQADDGTVITDETTEANEATGDDMTLLPATPAVDDAYYFGHLTKKFCTVKLTQSTQGAGSWTIVNEYWDGSAWTAIPGASVGVDTIADFTTGASTYILQFIPPADWETTTVGALTGYFIRKRVSVYASVSTQPLGQQAWLYTLEDGIGLPMPASGTLDKATMLCTTKSGANNDSVFLIVNLTQGTVDTITYTKALTIDTDATLSLDVAENDEIVIMQVKEDGTTEYADVNVFLKLIQ